MAKSYNVAVVGATGIVGEVFLDILTKRPFPLRSLKLIASPRSAGNGGSCARGMLPGK